jgi:hypothetical protein
VVIVVGSLASRGLFASAAVCGVTPEAFAAFIGLLEYIGMGGIVLVAMSRRVTLLSSKRGFVHDPELSSYAVV